MEGYDSAPSTTAFMWQIVEAAGLPPPMCIEHFRGLVDTEDATHFINTWVEHTAVGVLDTCIEQKKPPDFLNNLPELRQLSSTQARDSWLWALITTGGEEADSFVTVCRAYLPQWLLCELRHLADVCIPRCADLLKRFEAVVAPSRDHDEAVTLLLPVVAQLCAANRQFGDVLVNYHRWIPAQLGLHRGVEDVWCELQTSLDKSAGRVQTELKKIC